MQACLFKEVSIWLSKLGFFLLLNTPTLLKCVLVPQCLHTKSTILLVRVEIAISLCKSTNVDLLTSVRILFVNMLVMDRLYDTMEHRIIKWEKLQKRITGGIGAKIFDRKGEKKMSLLEDKLVAAFDLSAAILFLHNRNILYRDLKPGKGKRSLASKRGRAHLKLMANFVFL
jgi:hypothetical protein